MGSATTTETERRSGNEEHDWSKSGSPWWFYCSAEVVLSGKELAAVFPAAATGGMAAIGRVPLSFLMNGSLEEQRAAFPYENEVEAMLAFEGAQLIGEPMVDFDRLLAEICG